MKAYLYRVMLNKEEGVMAGTIRLLSAPLSFIYGVISRIRNRLYDMRVLNSYGLPVKVISVGNITLGGTGKTPFSLYLTEFLKNDGRQPAVHLRGYGSDEMWIFKSRIGEDSVIIGKDKVKVCRKYLKDRRPDCIILDDGFQHRRLERDLDILLINASEPFLDNRLMPLGTLREPISGLGRADIVVITKGTEQLRESAYNELRKISHAVLCLAEFTLDGFEDIKTGRSVPVTDLQRRQCIAVCGIASPGYFRYLLKEKGLVLQNESFLDDHHVYKSDEVEDMINSDYVILTTEKDAVKLKRGFGSLMPAEKFVSARVGIKIERGEKELHDRLRSVFAG